jgi:hypothetical protein
MIYHAYVLGGGLLPEEKLQARLALRKVAAGLMAEAESAYTWITWWLRWRGWESGNGWSIADRAGQRS